eukprot:903762-Prorocentrum_lima.AAC.1
MSVGVDAMLSGIDGGVCGGSVRPCAICGVRSVLGWRVCCSACGGPFVGRGSACGWPCVAGC